MHRILRVQARIDAAEGRTTEALSRYSEVIAKPVQVARELQRDKPYSSYTGRALAMLARVQQAGAAPDDAHASAAEAALNLSKTLGDDHPDTRLARQAAL